MKEKILALIYRSIEAFNSQSEPDQQLTKTETTVIFGNGSNIDSLGLINFIVLLEQGVNDEFSIDITLADERAMSYENSPFKTVSSLSDYIQAIVAKNQK